MVFPVVMYGCKNWTIARLSTKELMLALEVWCWRRLLRVLWTASSSGQSIQRKSTLNINWKDWCWNWTSKTLATWCKEMTYWKRPWCCKRLCAQLCLTLCNPMDCSPSGSSAHGLFQARILEMAPCPPPGDLPNPEIYPIFLMSPTLVGRFFTTSTTWKAQIKV